MLLVKKDHKDYKGNLRSKTWSVNKGPSMTVQSDADKADISKILQKYKQIGIVEHLNRADAMFMDVTEFSDLADAMRQSKTAEVEFMKMPSKVREIFNHDVAEWLDAAHDPEKRDALVRAGFVEEAEAVGEAAGVGISDGATPTGPVPTGGDGEAG